MEKNITLWLAILFLSVSFKSPLFSQEVRNFRKTVDLPMDGLVSIDTYKGSIEVKIWDKPEVEIIAEIESDGRGRREKEKVDQTEIKISKQDGRVSIRTDYDEIDDHGSWFFGLFGNNQGSLPFVHYKVTIPAGASVRIKDYKSETVIPVIRSFAHIETYKGKVEIGSIEGGADIETYKGEAKIRFKRITKESDFETYKGKIQIYLPEESSFRLDADLGRSNFQSDFDLPSKRKYKRNKDILSDINGGGKRITIHSEKGDIRLLKID